MMSTPLFRMIARPPYRRIGHVSALLLFVLLASDMTFVVLHAGSQQAARATSGTQGTQQPTLAPDPSVRRELITRYCVACHNDRLRTGGLALDSLDRAHDRDNAAA